MRPAQAESMGLPVVRLLSAIGITVVFAGLWIGVSSLRGGNDADGVDASTFLLWVTLLVVGYVGFELFRFRNLFLLRLKRVVGEFVNADEAADTPPQNFTRLGPLSEDFVNLHRWADSIRDRSINLLTKSKLLERDLRRYAEYLDAHEDGFVLLDRTQSIVFANRAAKEHLNVAPEEARGQHLREAIRDTNVVTFVHEADNQQTLTGVQHLELESDSGDLESEVLLYPVFGEDGSQHGSLVVYRKVAQLRNMQKLHSEFIDGIAHELRTPLTSIRAYVEMLVDGEAEDKQTVHNFYNFIYEETYRLSQLIDNMLNISMLETGTTHLDITPTRLKRLLEESADVVQPQCDQKNVELVVDLDDRLPTFDVDKSLFGMAVMNILSNAVKYTPEGGKVHLTTTSEEDAFLIQVRDTGIGIAEEDIEKVFEKFYRASEAQREPGSGVGLATTKQIVLMHGGQIHVESQLEKGSLFTIELPRALINKSIGD